MSGYRVNGDIAEISRSGYPSIMFLHNVGSMPIVVSQYRNTTGDSQVIPSASSLQWDAWRPLYAWCNGSDVSDLDVSTNSGSLTPQASTEEVFDKVTLTAPKGGSVSYTYDVGNAQGIEIRVEPDTHFPIAWPLYGTNVVFSGGVDHQIFTPYDNSYCGIRSPVYSNLVTVTINADASIAGNTDFFLYAQSFRRDPQWFWYAGGTRRFTAESKTLPVGTTLIPLPQQYGGTELTVYYANAMSAGAASRCYVRVAGTSGNVVAGDNIRLSALADAGSTQIMNWASIPVPLELVMVNGESSARNIYYTYRNNA